MERFNSTIENWEKDLRIDVLLEEKQKEELISYLLEKIEEIERGREEYLEECKEARKEYEGILPEKDFPFPKASNVSLGLARIHTDTIYTRIMQNIFDKDELVLVKLRLKREDVKDKVEYEKLKIMAEQIQEYLNWWAKDENRLKDILRHSAKEACKVGTSAIKVDYERKRKIIYDYKFPKENFLKKRTGIEAREVVEEGVKIYPIRIEDIGWEDTYDIEECQFLFIRFEIPNHLLQARIKEGFYNSDAEKVLEETQEELESRKERAEERGIEIPERPEKKYLYEVWFNYPLEIGGEKRYIWLVATIHKESGTLLRLILNPFFAQVIPVVLFRVCFNEFSLYGTGIPLLLKNHTQVINTLFNQSIDNNTLKNNLTLWVRAGSNLEKFKVYPGAKILSESRQDFDVITWGTDILPSTFNLITLTHRYAEEVSGATPYVIGKEQVQRPTASGTLSLLQEANKKIRDYIDNFREGLVRLFKLVILLTKQYKPYSQYSKSGEIKILDLTEIPVEVLMKEFVFDLNISTELTNVEVEKQMRLSIYQLLKDYYTWLLQLINVVLNPQIDPSILPSYVDIMKAMHKQMKEILKGFEIRDTENILPDVPDKIETEIIARIREIKEKVEAQMAQMQQAQAIAEQQPQIPRPAVSPEVLAMMQVPEQPSISPRVKNMLEKVSE